MRYRLIPLLLLLATAVSAQELLTPEMLWSLKRVNPEAVSSDGRYLYYTSRQVDWKTEKSSYELEKPISKGTGQYKTTIGFIDIYCMASYAVEKYGYSGDPDDILHLKDYTGEYDIAARELTIKPD